jgi:hypothetical protein
MLQLHAQLPLIMALRRAAAMLLAGFGTCAGTLIWRSLTGLRLPDRACSGGFSPSALPTICTHCGPFLVPLPCTQIHMAGLGGSAEVYGPSQRSSDVVVRERNRQLESAEQSLSNRQQIDPQVHSRPVEGRSECSVPLSLSGSNCQPSALTDPHSPGKSSRINRNE